MKRPMTPTAVFLICVALSGCHSPRAERREGDESVPAVVTADIQAGIEKYIEDRTRAGNGYFALAHGDRQLRLKLVRVHTEYLANLGPGRHFACVDLVDVGSDVYDVDFFLAGEPGAMTVTETTVHKINGQPYYTWERTGDGGWRHVPVEGAAHDLLGVVRERDEFAFFYQATLPELTAPARMWVPLPQGDAYQTVEVESIRTPGRWKILKEREHGNTVLFLTLGPEDAGKSVELGFRVERLEKAVYEESLPDPGRYLEPDRLVPANKDFQKIAAKVVAGKKGDLVRARALYDHVIDEMRYMKYGPGWGKGDAVYACDVRTGNCTDFHSYFIALARAVGIPARFAIGAAIPSERDEGGIDGYHCWAEFYAAGQWWPIDISEADKYAALATYYFGHHPANRIELSRGRDLVVDPSPAAGPINFLAYPVLEMDGRPVTMKVAFSFRRNAPGR
jgi:transglutaminase-like putative cysteine protease